MSETNEGSDDEVEVDLVEFETVGTDDEGDIVIDDVVVATDSEGHIIAVDETVAVVSPRGDDGELHVLEEDVTVTESDED
jgi:hypothetical protein